MSSKIKITRGIGCCYYPEHWPEERWSQDAAQMVAAGLTWVRIGEFAWSRIEPEFGEMNWDWMDKAIEILGSAGLKIILGTPTATPPRWMLDKWPDMLALDAQGNQRKFGSRRHYCFSHQGYRDACARIVGLLAERYGANPHVQAWQTDNEYGCHDTVVSYSESACAGFREWLGAKYGSIEALNSAWGNVFWSMEYEKFDQIDLPNLTVTEANPSHVMDFRRFSSGMVIEFNQIQTQILRKHTDAPLLHNYMGRIVDFDHFELGKDLDIATWDSYPTGFLEDRSDQNDAWIAKFMRQGDPDFQAFHHDLYRAVGKGRWWVMEQQPGPVNWAPYNPAPLPGMVRLWSWEAFAHGAEMVCYFRWRQVPFGQEQLHSGLLNVDGRPAQGLAEAKRVGEEILSLPNMDIKPAKIAIVFDYPSAWAWQTQPQGKSFDYFRLVFDFYRALRKLGLSVDFVSADISDLSAFDLVFAPGLMSVSKELEQAVEDFEGLTILGPRYNSKTPNMQILSDAPGVDGLDCKIGYVESLRAGAQVPLEHGGAFVHWVENVEATHVMERTIAGDVAMVGNENVWYLGGWPDETAMERILSHACKLQEIPTLKLPEGVRVRDSTSHRFVFNYSAEPVNIFGLELESAGVVWLPNT